MAKSHEEMTEIIEDSKTAILNEENKTLIVETLVVDKSRTAIFNKDNRTVIIDKGSRGIGFCGLLTIVLITLKLTGYITWSWWWVIGPLWIPTALVFLLIVMFLLGVYISDKVDEYRFRRR